MWGGPLRSRRSEGAGFTPAQIVRMFELRRALFASALTILLLTTGCGHSAAGSPAARAKAQPFINSGLAKMNHGDSRGAMADYNSALQADPDSAVAYYDRGAVEYRLSQWKAVVSDFRTARAKADAGSPLSSSTRYYSYVYGGIADEWLGDYASALNDEKSALKIQPASALALLNLGYTLAQTGHFHDAIGAYVAAVAHGANSAQTFTLLGWARIQTGNPRQSIDDFRTAIRTAGRYALAYADRGVAEADLRDYPAAIADFTRAIHLDGSNAWLFDQRCDSYNDVSDYSDAMYDCTRAIHLASHFAEAFVDRSRTYINEGDYKDGIADATAAIRYTPNYAMAYNNRGYARQSIGDIRGAFADYAMALHFNPNLALAKVNRNWLISWVAQNRDTPQWQPELSYLTPAMEEPSPQPTGDQYAQLASTCGSHYESGSDYYSECMTWGLSSAQASEEDDKQQAQAAVEDAQYAQAQAENDAAQAQQDAEYNQADQEAAAAQAQDNADYAASDASSSESESYSEPAPAPESDSGGDSGGG